MDGAPAPEGPGPRESRFWLAALLAAAVVALSWQVVRAWVAPGDLSDVQQVFLPGALTAVRPEPREFALFLWVALTFPVALLASFGALGAAVRRAPSALLRAGVRAGPWIQFAVVAVLGFQWLAGDHFGAGETIAGALLALVGVAAIRPVGAWWASGRTGGVTARACDAAALLLIAWRLLPALQTDASLPFADPAVGFHFPYQSDEFFAPLAGNYPLVGFVAQYVNVLSVLAVPVFAIFGFGVLPFTALMVALSGLGLACVYASLKGVFPENGRALLVFVLFLGTACYAIPSDDTSSTWYYLYNYYAVGPMRILGPNILLWMVALLAAAGPRGRIWPLAVVGALTAVNNLDFGLPALLAALGATIVVRVRGEPVSRWALPMLGTAGVFALALGGVVAGWGGLLRYLSGAWPDPSVAFAFQKIFALHGFYLLPMPSAGLHVIVLSTHLLVFCLVVLDLARPRLYSGTAAALLAFNTVYAVGTFTYYVGRSHPDVLTLTLGPWALTVLLTVGALLRSAPPGTLSPRDVLLRPVAVGALFLVGCMATRSVDLPTPWAEVERLLVPETGAAPYSSLVRTRAAFVRGHLPDGEATLILAADSHWIALEAGVRNLFRWNHPESLVTYAQVNLELDEADRAGVRHVFGDVPPATAAMLRSHGFAPDEVDGEFVHFVRAPE